MDMMQRYRNKVSMLQHGLDLRRLLELGPSLRPDFIHGNTIRKFNQRQSGCEIHIKNALSYVSFLLDLHTQQTADDDLPNP
jgi:hypothetical protein